MNPTLPRLRLDALFSLEGYRAPLVFSRLESLAPAHDCTVCGHCVIPSLSRIVARVQPSMRPQDCRTPRPGDEVLPVHPGTGFVPRFTDFPARAGRQWQRVPDCVSAPTSRLRSHLGCGTNGRASLLLIGPNTGKRAVDFGQFKPMEGQKQPGYSSGMSARLL
jgi:hypothetical protein